MCRVNFNFFLFFFGEVGELAASAEVAPEGLVGHVRQPAPRGGSKLGRKERPDYKQTRSSKRRWRHVRGLVGRKRPTGLKRDYSGPNWSEDARWVGKGSARASEGESP